MAFSCSKWLLHLSPNWVQTYHWWNNESGNHCCSKRTPQVKLKIQWKNTWIFINHNRFFRLAQSNDHNSKIYKRHQDISAQLTLKETICLSKRVGWISLLFHIQQFFFPHNNLLVSPLDNESYSLTRGECRIMVPALNMCFMTNKLQPLNLVGNVFEGTRLTRPLTLKDYINILTDKHKYVDHELSVIISNIESFTARSRRTNETDKPSNDSSG